MDSQGSHSKQAGPFRSPSGGLRNGEIGAEMIRKGHREQEGKAVTAVTVFCGANTTAQEAAWMKQITA